FANANLASRRVSSDTESASPAAALVFDEEEASGADGGDSAPGVARSDCVATPRSSRKVTIAPPLMPVEISAKPPVRSTTDCSRLAQEPTGPSAAMSPSESRGLRADRPWRGKLARLVEANSFWLGICLSPTHRFSLAVISKSNGRSTRFEVSRSDVRLTSSIDGDSGLARPYRRFAALLLL